MVDPAQFRGYLFAACLAAVGLVCETLTGAPDADRRQDARGVPARIVETAGVQGGLVVHLGCGDGRLTAALRTGESYLVHGLETDPAKVGEARRNIQALGVYGPVSVDQFDGRHLPYIDNLVRLLVVSGPSKVTREELLRVLCPGGVVVTVATEQGQPAIDKLVKPWPDDMDEWTHWLHDAGNSGVARDSRVGPPRRLQWVAEPLWARGHEVISSVNAVVTARGRIFSAVDEGQTAIYSLPSQWMLVARDAFSGVLLWKQPLPYWSPPVTLGGFTTGFQPQRLATDGQRVYIPTGAQAILTALDAATGTPLKTLGDVRGTSEILCADGFLVAVTGPAGKGKGERNAPGLRAAIVALRADTGAALWTKAVAPAAIALASGRIFYWADGQVIALDAQSGAEAWRTAFAAPAAKGAKRLPAPTLRVHEGSVYIECASRLAALSADDGKPRWERKDAPVSRGELFAAGKLLWRPQGSTLVGHDPATGEVRQAIDAAGVFTPGHHARCYPCKATDRYVITNNRGAEFVSLTAGEHVANDWLRGSCGHGIVPANGLLYVPPNPCFCYPGAKITGFNALAPERSEKGEERSVKDEDRLEKGPAYNSPGPPPSALGSPLSSDWPTYRHDAARSGAAGCDLPPNVALRWAVDLHGRITPSVACDGRLYVAAPDHHTLFALAVGDGRALWQFTAGGRIDSPPTVFGNCVLFGCADGRVYCLRSSDGALAWRFQAAPSTQRMVAFGQLESPWRVHGSVLILEELAYFTAGRSSFLDGGLRLFALEPATGRVVHEARLDTSDPIRSDARDKPFLSAYHMEGAQSDILTSQGGSIYLGQFKFSRGLERQEVPYVLPDPRRKTVAMDLSGQPFVAENENPQDDYEDHQRQWIERSQTGLVARLRQQFGSFNYGARQMGLHVLATGGFLDDTWFNRTYWMYSASWPGFYIGHRAARSGQLLVVGPERTYAVQAFPSRNLQSPLFIPGEKGYLLLADANTEEPVLDDRTVEVAKGWGFTRSRPPAWFVWIPIRVRGMVLAGQTLFVAGPPDLVAPDDPLAAFEGRKGGVLRACASADGKKLAELALDAPPVFDGLIAADGRLFFSGTDGKVLCFGVR